MGQLVDARYHLHDVEQLLRDQLLRSFGCCGYNYAWEMMSIELQAEGNWNGTSDVSMLERTGMLPSLRMATS